MSPEETYQDVSEKAAEVDLKIARRAKDAISDLSSGVRKLGSKAVQKADGALTAVGETMTHLSDSIRENTPSEGTIASAAGAVADGLKTGGQYLSEHGIEDVTKEMKELVRNYPFYSLGIGIGVGMLLRTMFSRR